MAPNLGKLDIKRETRLGNPKCAFTIAAVFGDRDINCSEGGAEEVIKQNCNFESGRSQLFKLKDCSHLVNMEQPEALIELMVGHFEGTIKGTWEPKRKGEYTLSFRAKK
jgi:pimeloyl-ACP methyl ester carboxylesterase